MTGRYNICVLGSPRANDAVMDKRKAHIVREWSATEDNKGPSICNFVPKLTSKGWSVVAPPWDEQAEIQKFDCKVCWRIWFVDRFQDRRKR